LRDAPGSSLQQNSIRSYHRKACRRYKAHIDQQRAQREQEKAEAAKPQPRRCWSCHQPETVKRIVVSFGGAMLICDRCVGKAARLIGRQKQKAVRRKRRR
jgi:hypothetical protein